MGRFSLQKVGIGRNRINRVSDLLDDHGNWKTKLILDIFYPTDANAILKIRPCIELSEESKHYPLG
jgi:hypothetical protein